MLSRLIITFLCAAAIGSVSGAFLTFDPTPVVLKDTDIYTSVSVQLKSKPTEAVTVYFESSSTFMSTCVIVFDPNSWDVPQKINVSKHLSYCGITKNIVTTFDSFSFSFSKPGWYQVASTEDIKVQILRGECGAGLKCFTAVVFRYGPTVMSMDTRGPVKGAGEYSLTHVTPNTNGIRHTPGSRPGEHTIVFPCGSKLNIVVVNTDGVANLYVNLFLVAGYTTPRGLCNIPRPFSPDNRLIGSDGKSYNRGKENEVDAFFDSWGIKDEDVLTNPDARASIPPIQQPGTVCKFPANPPPKPEIPVPPPPTTTTTTTTTGTTTTSSSSTLDLSESTLSPTITYTLSSTTVTTSPSTTSTTSPYLPDPPPSGGYVPLPQPDRYVRPPPPSPSGYVPPPPSPQPDVVGEIQRCPRPARI
ncbi:hypothetical protein BASA62_002137 [Batrachochytrium salamandrivorans]|nr:hypothetical protein BASA62_002137 [Batrachochytrium salamandrivorans]